jgi:DUF1707 SHOCT-like domain
MGSELQGAGGYRVGDADRNRTTDLLKEAHAAGYLTLEETDERLGTALAARTRGELDRLVADLPPEWRASQERGRDRPAARAPAPRLPCGGRLADAAGDGRDRRHRACRPHSRLLVLPVAAAVDLLLRLRPPGSGRLATAPLVNGLVPGRARGRSRVACGCGRHPAGGRSGRRDHRTPPRSP